MKEIRRYASQYRPIWYMTIVSRPKLPIIAFIAAILLSSNADADDTFDRALYKAIRHNRAIEESLRESCNSGPQNVSLLMVDTYSADSSLLSQSAADLEERRRLYVLDLEDAVWAGNGGNYVSRLCASGKPSPTGVCFTVEEDLALAKHGVLRGSPRGKYSCERAVQMERMINGLIQLGR
jgi:hypothetical protein